VCISWTIKCLILLIHGATIKFLWDMLSVSICVEWMTGETRRLSWNLSSTNPKCNTRYNKTGSVCITEHGVASAQPLLQWKARSFIYYDCVFLALVSQHAQCIRRILSYVACLLYQIFPLYLINDTLFRKNVVKHEMCVLIFYTNLSEIFLILGRIKRQIAINTYMNSCKVPVILVRF
jgi:hypothetical protein